MKLKRLITTAMKWAPVIYPVAKKVLNSRKQKSTVNRGEYRNRTSR